MGKLATALVVKYRGGYIEVVSGDATYGRREAMVSLDVGTDEQATIIGTTILGLLAADDTRYSVEILPTVAAPTTRPVFGFNLLDYIQTPNADLQANAFRRVTGLTITQADDEGNLGFVPEMGPLGELAEEELQRAIRRMLVGSLVGAVDAFAPTAVRTTEAAKHEPALQPIVFSYAGALTAVTSPRWYVRRNAVATKITLSLGTAGTSTSTVAVYKNGSSWHSSSGLTSGVNKVDIVLASEQLAKDDYLQAVISTVGTGAADLTVQVDIRDESSPPPD